MGPAALYAVCVEEFDLASTPRIETIADAHMADDALLFVVGYDRLISCNGLPAAFQLRDLLRHLERFLDFGPGGVVARWRRLGVARRWADRRFCDGQFRLANAFLEVARPLPFRDESRVCFGSRAITQTEERANGEITCGKQHEAADEK